MNDFSWIEILGGSTLFGTLTTFIGYIFGGRKKQSQELKGAEIDNEVKEVDYATKIHELYEKILERKQLEVTNLTEQLQKTISDAKEDREYFRSEINPLRKEVEELRQEVASVNLRNGILTEAAETWEGKFKELQKEHDQLKKAFDNLKKSMK